MTHWTKYWVIIHNILVVSIKMSDEYKYTKLRHKYYRYVIMV